MAKVKKYPMCPKCCGELRTVITVDRMNRQECRECTWRGNPFVPKINKNVSVKEISVDGGSYRYETYDFYGHISGMSQAYGSLEECKKAAQKDIDRDSIYYGGKKFTAVIWPLKVKVKASVVLKSKKVKK